MEKNNNILKRIVLDPEVMGGKPVIKGTRLTVQFIVGLLAQGMTLDEILVEYKGLEKEDVLACLGFVHEALADISFAPLSI